MPGTDTDLAPTDQKTGADAKTEDKSTVDVNLDKDNGGKPEDKASSQDKTKSEDKATDKKPDDAKPVVPEKYVDPTLPEGMKLNPELKSKFDAVAKELGLTQEQYQKIVNVQAEAVSGEVKTKMDQFNQTVQGWKDKTKEIHGAQTEAVLAQAAKGIDKIFSDPKENKEFREMLSEEATGLGNWNLMVKALSFVGKAVSEDKFIEGARGDDKKKSTAEVLYDHPTSVAARTAG